MIEQIRDPRTRKEVTFVTGKIDGVYINPLKEIKTYPGPKDQLWTPTHSASIVVDGTRIQFGLTEKEKINSKDVDGNYHALTKGMEVSVEITKIGEYQGKPTYDSKASKVTVLDVSGAVAQGNGKPQGNSQSSSQSNSGSFKRDDTGIIAGNARTAAFAFLKGKPYKSVGDVNELVEKFAVLADAKRKSYKASNPSLDDFQVGVSVGQSVVLAAGVAKAFEDVSSIVDEILNDVIPHSVEVVKEIASGKVVKEIASGKVGKAVVQEEHEEAPYVNGYIDDDIPFMRISDKLLLII